MSVNNFDVLKAMGERNMDVQLAPLSQVTNLKKVRAGTQVTIGVGGDVVAAIGIENKFVGGLILADKTQFATVRAELEAAQNAPKEEQARG